MPDDGFGEKPALGELYQEADALSVRDEHVWVVRGGAEPAPFQLAEVVGGWILEDIRIGSSLH